MNRDELISLNYTDFLHFTRKRKQQKSYFATSFKGTCTQNNKGEHYSTDQSVHKAKKVKCILFRNNSANWGIVKHHRHGIIMTDLLAILHMCLLVGKGPLLVFN